MRRAMSGVVSEGCVCASLVARWAALSASYKRVSSIGNEKFTFDTNLSCTIFVCQNSCVEKISHQFLLFH